MKKLNFFLPILMIGLFSLVGYRIIGSDSISPGSMIGLSALLLVFLLLSKPKASAAKPMAQIEEQIRGEFAKDAFADDPVLGAKFQAALTDYSKNMPKAALNKLQKLAPQCTGDPEVYAVAMASAMIHTTLNKPTDAIKEYVRALSIHQDAPLAIQLGSCYQRIGELEKAMDSYEFALDLDPELTEARTKLATALVADGRYSMGLKQALTVLETQENNDSALATAAICSALLNDPVMYKHYLEKAVDNGYKRDKITQTVDALKKVK